MKITEYTHPLTEQKTYKIMIEQGEEPFEIAECFKKQYPKARALIMYSEITSLKIGMILVGIHFGGKNVKKS